MSQTLSGRPIPAGSIATIAALLGIISLASAGQYRRSNNSKLPPP